MDYETPDGSVFSLREVWTDDDDQSPRFQYTSVNAIVAGRAYACRFEQALDTIDESEISDRLRPVPLENIYPLHTATLTITPVFDAEQCYLKTPSFMYEDSLPHQDFVAKCLYHEAATLEHLRAHPHRNIVAYHGCVVNEDARVTGLCLERLGPALATYLPDTKPSASDLDSIIEDVLAGIKHLHSLGLAHNDLNPDNVCVRRGETITGVIVDFDSCLPFGQKLLKGTPSSDTNISSAENDLDAWEMLRDYILDYSHEFNTDDSACSP